MADVIRIGERLSRMPRQAAQAEPREAEILLFTGVRYERWEATSTPPTDKKPLTGGAKKR